MAKKKYYYMVLDSNDCITAIGTTYTLTREMTEITRLEYNNYKDIIESIPDRDGYIKKVTLHKDGSYEVEYIPMIIVEEDNEE